MNKKILGIAIAGLIVVAAVLIWLLGFYPQLSVNGEIVLKRDIDFELNALEKVTETYKILAQNEIGNITDDREIKRGILEKIIENTLVRNFFAGNPELTSRADALVEEKIMELRNYETENLDELSEILYGMNFNETRERILYPEARILALKESQKENLSAFLRALKENAEIKFYFIPFAWNKENATVTFGEKVGF